MDGRMAGCGLGTLFLPVSPYSFSSVCSPCAKAKIGTYSSIRHRHAHERRVRHLSWRTWPLDGVAVRAGWMLDLQSTITTTTITDAGDERSLTLPVHSLPHSTLTLTVALILTGLSPSPNPRGDTGDGARSELINRPSPTCAQTTPEYLTYTYPQYTLNQVMHTLEPGSGSFQQMTLNYCTQSSNNFQVQCREFRPACRSRLC